MGSCFRCQKSGVVIPEQIFTDQGIVTVLKCLWCGEVIDGVILYNRKHTPTTSDLRRVKK